MGLTLAAALWLAGCGDRATRIVPYADPLAGFVGGVAADEPRAAVAGRAMLDRGGTAADAAVAMFFGLTASYPSAASLSSGGVCVVYDPKTKKAEVLDFSPPATGGAVAAPGAVRGMALLQGRYGKLRWEETLVPGEQAARLGVPVSRAYARVLQDLVRDRAVPLGVAQLAADTDGRLFDEGAIFRQEKLALSITRLRTAGGGDLYTGQLARAYLADVTAAGGTLTPEQLRAYVPQWRTPKTVAYGRSTLLLPPTPAGDLVAVMWPQLSGSPGLSLFSTSVGGSQPARDRIPDVLAAAYGTAPPLFARYGSTGFTAMDRQGQAVACTVSNGAPFGLGRIGGETGILLAPAPGGQGDERPHNVPLVVANTDSQNSFVAATATGGSPAAAAMVQSLLEVVAAQSPAAAGVASSRVFRTNASVDLLVEPGLDPALAQAYGAKGLKLVEGADIGRVNVMACNGLPRAPESCRFAQDRRGAGLALGDTAGETVLNCNPTDASRYCARDNPLAGSGGNTRR